MGEIFINTQDLCLLIMLKLNKHRAVIYFSFNHIIGQHGAALYFEFHGIIEINRLEVN